MPVLVKLKSTGQLGYVEEKDYDPNLYEPVNQGGGTQEQSGGIAKKTGNFLLDLLKPITNTGQRIGGAGIELAQSAALAGSDAARGSGNNDLSLKLAEFAAKDNPLLKDQTAVDKATDPLQIAKDSLGVLAFGIPAGKATSIAGKTVPKLGTKTAGALSGLLTGVGQSESTDAETILGEGAIGAAGGAVTAGLLNKLFKTGKTTKGAGDALRQGINKPKVPASPFMADEEKLISKTLDELGIKGSSKAKLDKLPMAMKDLSAQIDGKLTNKGLSTSKVVSIINDNLDNNLAFVPDDPVYEKAKTRLMDGLVKKANQGKTGVKITDRQLFEYKQFLNSKLSRAFDKIAKGTPLTPAEETGLAIWESIDNVLAEVNPGVKQLTRTQSMLYKAAGGLVESRNAGIGLPIINNKLSARPLQATGDTIGRMLQGAGGSADNVLSKLPQPTGTGTGITSSVLLNKLLGSEQPQQGMNNASIPQGDTSLNSILQMQQPQQETNAITPEMLVMARLTLSDTEYKKLKDIADLQEEQTSGGGSAGSQAVDQLKSLYADVQSQGLTASDSGLFNRLAGGVKGSTASLTQNSPEAANYNAARQAFLSIIVRNLGEKGTLTDKDIERIDNALPKFSDSPSVANRKFIELQTLMKQIQ